MLLNASLRTTAGRQRQPRRRSSPPRSRPVSTLLAFGVWAAAGVGLPSAVAASSSAADKSRLGNSDFSSLDLMRTGAGVNVVSVGVGTPAQTVNLTLSPNVIYVAVATSDCQNCVEDGSGFNSASSSTFDSSSQSIDYTFNYPGGSDDTLNFVGKFVDDNLTMGILNDNETWPIVAVSNVTDAGAQETLSDGTAGFFGLGVDTAQLSRSIIPAMLMNDNGGSLTDVSFTVGFDIDSYGQKPGSAAGTVYWGGVPNDTYTGAFNWLAADPNQGWRFAIDTITVGSQKQDTSAYFATLDPGFDPIYVPAALAESLFAGVSGAARDSVYTDRWNVNCSAEISMVVRIGGQNYNVNSSTLVTNRDVAGRTCWSNIVAWGEGSVPESSGEIRLGTSFMSGVSSVLYYANESSYVGLAAKPATVNANNLTVLPGPNHKVLAAVLGTLIPLLVIGLVLFYIHKSSERQGFLWFAMRQRQEMAAEAMVARSVAMEAAMAPPMAMAPQMTGIAGVPPPFYHQPHMVPAPGMPLAPHLQPMLPQPTGGVYIPQPTGGGVYLPPAGPHPVPMAPQMTGYPGYGPGIHPQMTGTSEFGWRNY